MPSAPRSGATPDHGCNVVTHDFLASVNSLSSSSSRSSEVPNGDPASVPSNAVDSAGPSGPEAASRPDVSSQLVYSDVVRGSVNSQPVAYVPDEQNELPSRPLTVFFNPRSRIPANEVFEALQASGTDSSSVSCIQRQSSGEIVLTFRNAAAKERFLAANVVTIRSQPFALQDIDRPLTYLQIFDAPHEMPDATIIQRLAKFCDVVHCRRGHFREPGWEHVQDGVRHYRVRVKRPIPNYVRFGKVLVHFRYENQPRTCRHCNQTGHLVNSCHSVICYNCEELGHLASDCPSEVLCNICKQPDHRAINCPYSWSRQNIENVEPAEPTVAEPTIADPPADPEVLSSEENVLPPETPADDSMEQMDSSVSEQDSEDLPPDATPELFDHTENSEPAPTPTPTPKPQRARSGRQPAKISSTVIPSRQPTQPVLTPGKPRDDSAEHSDIAMDTEHSEKDLKRKGNERPRTNKHKKH